MRGFVLAFLACLLAFFLKKSGLLWNHARSIPLGTFWRAPGFSMEDLPDLKGKFALVTGASSGIGRATALQLAAANATVLLACRDLEKCKGLAEEIAAKGGRAKALVLDLLDLRSVEALAEGLLKELPALHVLVNNAGIATKFPFTLSKDGLEATFQANYLGHFWLTKRLLPLLERSVQARVVHLSSGAHRGAPAEGVPLSKAAINDEKRMGPYARYGMAKLANLVLAKELQRRSGGKGLLSNAVHPGVVATDMLREDNFKNMLGERLGPLAFAAAQLRNRLFAYSPETAALSVLHCVAEPGVGGELFVPVATRWQPWHAQANNATFGAELWRFSEELVAEALQ